MADEFRHQQPGRAARLCARAFTLLEVLIALAIVLTLGALALPVALDSLAERSFQAAGDVLRDQLLLARAHAQHTGISVQVVYNPERREISVSRFDLDALQSQDTPRPAIADAAGESGSAANLDSPVQAVDLLADALIEPDVVAGATRIVEPWAVQPLAKSLRLQLHRPPDGAARPGATTLEVDAQGSVRASQAQSALIVAVYLPDGSPLVADPLWLVDDDGRAARLRVNPWSGEPAIERDDDATIPDQSSPDGEPDDEGWSVDNEDVAESDSSVDDVIPLEPENGGDESDE